MKIKVEGIEIELTPEQVQTIEVEKKRRKRNTKTFVGTLEYYGFSRVKGLKDCFEHPRGWYAEFLDSNSPHVWMTGKELKTTGFMPGGWVYFSVERLREELERALNYG